MGAPAELDDALDSAVEADPVGVEEPALQASGMAVAWPGTQPSGAVCASMESVTSRSTLSTTARASASRPRELIASAKGGSIFI